MKNKHLWLALGEGLLFMILFLHRYNQIGRAHV